MWGIDEWIILVSVLLGCLIGFVIGLTIRIKNNGRRLSGKRLVQSKPILKSDTMPSYLLCPHCLGKVAICHFQPNAQHQEQETSRIKHELNQE